jgi:CheY-like chemotaxis protein
MAMVDTNILLVDDDQDTCASMSDIFLDLGYTVDMAHDGPGALEMSERHQSAWLYSTSKCPAWTAWNSADA